MSLLDKLKLAGKPASATPDDALRARVIEALRLIHDPELPINIYDLGLIYALEIDDLARVNIRMTLTAPGCPVAQSFPAQVEDAIERVPGVSRAQVELVWEPPWDKDRMSLAARVVLGH
jgi:FeS assembly SUF system protein